VLGELASCVLQNTTTASNENWQCVYLYVSGNEANKYINENIDKLAIELGPKTFSFFGLIIHKIFREAATTVPYKDIFNETEWGCQWSESKCVVVVTVSLEILNILYTKINLSYKYIYICIYQWNMSLPMWKHSFSRLY
jgi:hypothetical protein